jgi:hypothetical protein
MYVFIGKGIYNLYQSKINNYVYETRRLVKFNLLNEDLDKYGKMSIFNTSQLWESPENIFKVLDNN